MVARKFPLFIPASRMGQKTLFRSCSVVARERRTFPSQGGPSWVCLWVSASACGILATGRYAQTDAQAVEGVGDLYLPPHSVGVHRTHVERKKNLQSSAFNALAKTIIKQRRQNTHQLHSINTTPRPRWCHAAPAEARGSRALPDVLSNIQHAQD